MLVNFRELNNLYLYRVICKYVKEKKLSLCQSDSKTYVVNETDGLFRLVTSTQSQGKRLRWALVSVFQVCPPSAASVSQAHL